MDSEVKVEQLINFIFPDGVPEEHLNNPDFLISIRKLGSSQNKDKRSPDEELNAIDKEIQNFALSNYKTFIESSNCTREFHKDICQIENNLQTVLDTIPRLLADCEGFLNISTEIKERKRKNDLILSNYDEILQILEIPQFMNSCIRNELYEEAILLTSFVKRLSVKLGDIPVIEKIAKDVDKSWWSMMRQLLRHLTTDISLPKCLHIIGYLRRMNVFSEVELRIKFLQARNVWLDALLSKVPTDNKNTHLTAVIDITRVNIFNIVTQYKAVFTEDEVVLKQTDLKNSVFHSWLSKRINDFVSVVDSDLRDCAPSSLDSLLDQCMYFGQSFGRIGADFRGLVIHSFISSVQNNFRNAIWKADQQFEQNMNKFVIPKGSVISGAMLLSNELSSDKQSLSPSISLLEYYPLAEYCNAILSAFNDLRFCTPIGSVISVTNYLHTSLENISKQLLLYYEREQMHWLDTEREMFLKMCACFKENLVPFIHHCLQALFEPSKVAEYLEVSVSTLEDEGLGYLNVAEITKLLIGIE